MVEIFGFNAVWEALQAGVMIRKLILAEDEKGKNRQIYDLAVKKGIPVEAISRKEFKKIYGEKKQWIIAQIQNPVREMDDFLESLAPDPASLLLILDQIQDPQNLGSILRTAEACAVQGVAISLHRTAPITPAVFKASAGAISHLKICQVPSLGNFLTLIKEKGFWIAATDSRKGVNLFTTELNFPLALILGSEGWGVRPLLLKRCDFLLRLPMFGKISSLNVSVACGVMLYEIRRKQIELGLFQPAEKLP
ncbi:MAG: 23S rRNA (guanosine(2251)-2'-O)-methyltransferase RlmB [bacterium]